jgi:hypothetical protein
MTKKELENIKTELKDFVTNYLQVLDKNGNPLPQPEDTFSSTGHQVAYGTPQREWEQYIAQSTDCNVKSNLVKPPSVQSMLIDLNERTCKLNDVIDILYCKLNPLIEPTPAGIEGEPLRDQSSPLVDQIRCIDDRINAQIKKISWLIDNITL